jgi:uncharacterized coiled-coil protein SlyX
MDTAQHATTKTEAHDKATRILTERRTVKLKVAAQKSHPAPDEAAPSSSAATPSPPLLGPSGSGVVGVALAVAVANAETANRKARETLADLVTRLASARLDGTTRTKERGQLAFDALSGRVPEAVKRLEQLHVEVTHHDSVIKSLEAAVAEAHVRVSDSEEALRALQGALNAQRVLQHLDALREHAEALDVAASNVLDGYHSLRDQLRSIRALGCHHPSETLSAAASRRALQAAFSQTDLEVGDLLRPNERRSFTQVVNTWCDSISVWCAERMHVAGQED